MPIGAVLPTVTSIPGPLCCCAGDDVPTDALTTDDGDPLTTDDGDILTEDA